MKLCAGLWRRPGYGAWFAADTATAIGVAVRSLAVSLVGYAVSGSTVAAGWLGSASMIAQQVFGVFGGTYVDRHDRRTLIIVNAVMSMLCWGSVAGLLLTGGLRYSILLAIAVVSSAVNGFLGSATDAMLKSIIDMRDYPKARSLNEGRDATVNMAGSPVGGFLYGIRPWLPFLIIACMYAVAGVAATGIRESLRSDVAVRLEAGTAASDDSAASEAGSSGSFFKDFREGWSWSLHRTMLVMTMIVSALLNFGINGVQYGIQLHLVSAGMNGAYIGFVNTGIFCTMLVGAFIANRMSDRLPAGPVICAGFLFSCLAVVPLVCTSNYWVMLICNSLSALPFPIINAMMLGFVFAKTPDSMQGRITVTLTVPAQALSMFCSAAAGSLLPVCGFRRTILVFLIAMLVSAAIVVVYRPLRTIPRADAWDGAELR
ncbi:MFS transporter [uncultured Bifidobacterium sp.]|uniref:MFS transporter n=1 Tax=uncultured Bifidobacterium sp. TaxID=165187 RepID=UPI003419037A